MEQNILIDLLKKYETKRLNSLNDLEYRKEELFKSFPELEKIENELNSISIGTAKAILASNDPKLLNNLQENIDKLKLEKNKILKKIGKSEDYLEPVYDCSTCKDTGYINISSQSILCTCLKQELFNIAYNKSNISNLETENFENFNLEFYSDKSEVKKYNSETSPRENIKLIKDIAIKFISNFDDISEKNLLFTGNSGTGKSFLSNCIASECLKLSKTVLYQTSPVLFDTVIGYRLNKNTNTLDIYGNLLNVDLLIIDDLGTENTNSMVSSELFNIINTRILNQHNKTIISTNLSLNDLFSKYDERITSRLIGNYLVCKFYGDDIRLVKKGVKL